MGMGIYYKNLIEMFKVNYYLIQLDNVLRDSPR